MKLHAPFVRPASEIDKDWVHPWVEFDWVVLGRVGSGGILLNFSSVLVELVNCGCVFVHTLCFTYAK